MNPSSSEAAALLTHECRLHAGLKISPHHCELRRKRGSKINPNVTNWYDTSNECIGCPGAIPIGERKPQEAKQHEPPPEIIETKPEQAPEKQCKGCKRTLPATTENFYKSKDTMDGLWGKCKDCCRAEQRVREHKRSRKAKQERKKANAPKKWRRIQKPSEAPG